MEAQINAITVTTQDIKALRKFYHDVLGWTVSSENEKVVIFRLNNLMLTLCTPDVFKEYTGGDPGKSNSGFYFAINLDSPKRVNDCFKKLAEKNVNIIKTPEKTFWGGFSGFFADPEGNRWEVCHNPISRTKI